MTYDRSLPDALRRLRRERGLSLGEVAHRAKVSAHSLQGWESGRRSPKGASLARTLDVLEAPARLRSRLLGGVDPAYARVALAGTALGPPLALGTVLRAMRLRRGITQSELAAAVGMTQGAVAKWESGDSVPPASTLHEVGFALGAAVEETLALTAARGGAPEGLPARPAAVNLPYLLSVDLQEMVAFAYEAELWRRAAIDERWEPALSGVLAQRANLYALNGRLAEIPDVAERALRLVTTTEGRVAAAPAVNALSELALRRGEGPAVAARMCAAWAERLPNSAHKAWMLGSEGNNLARGGRSREGVARILDARAMDEDAGSFDAMTAFDASHSRAQSLATVYLEGGMAAPAAEALAPFRHPSTDQTLYARIQLANGRPLDEASLAYLRYYALRRPLSRHWKNQVLLEEIEAAQTRVTGVPAEALPPSDLSPEEEGRRLWAAVPGGLPE